MASDIDEQLIAHKISVYLYPIHLPGQAEDNYLTKTKSGTPLSAENVCAAAGEVIARLPVLSPDVYWLKMRTPVRFHTAWPQKNAYRPSTETQTRHTNGSCL
jgi:hypothetical protein